MGQIQSFADVDTTGNNFTMTDITGGLPVDGANDVHFTWDGTLKTEVALSGQVANATLSASTCDIATGSSPAATDFSVTDFAGLDGNGAAIAGFTTEIQ